MAVLQNKEFNAEITESAEFTEKRGGEIGAKQGRSMLRPYEQGEMTQDRGRPGDDRG